MARRSVVPGRWARSVEGWLSRGGWSSDVAQLALLGAAGCGLLLAWIALWPLSYRLTHGNDFTYTYLVTYDVVWKQLWDLILLANDLLPGFEPNPSLELLVNALVGVFCVAALGYLAGLMLLERGAARVRGALWIVFGFQIAFQAVLFFLPGVFTTDVFSYLMYDHMTTHGFNPYLYRPLDFPGHPLLNWIHPIWHAQPSVYGPLWTAVGWLMGRATEPLSLMERVFTYRALMNGLHLANTGLMWWLLGRLLPASTDHDGRCGARPLCVRHGTAAPRWERVTALTVFAWNPLILFEVSANAHNDALMVSLLLLALVPLALYAESVPPSPGGAVPGNHHTIQLGAAWVGGVFLVGLSALVKYTTGIVGLLYVVALARQAGTVRRAVVGAVLGIVLTLVAALVLFWPWLQLPQLFQPMLDAAGGRYYTNSLADLVALTLADQVLVPHARMFTFEAQEAARWWTKAVTRGLFGVYLLGEMVILWRNAAGSTGDAIRAVLSAATRVFLVLLLVVFTWVLTWYFMWPLALATLLGWKRHLTRVVVAFTLTALPIFYAHHYWSEAMPGSLLLLYAFPPLLVAILPWFARRVRSGSVAVPTGLTRAVQLKRLSRPANVADID